MKFNVRDGFSGIVLAVILMSLTACQATVGGSKVGERYELKRSPTMPIYWETTVKKDVNPVYNAVLAGAKDLGLQITVKKVDRLSGLVEGSFADNTQFKIRLSYEAPDVTLIRINAGLTGNKNRSVQLFRAIEKHF